MANKSLSSSGSTTCVSGSPKRALYSTTFGPSFVSISPTYSTPLNVKPSAFIARSVGSRISRSVRSAMCRVYSGLGANAPMPPVFGPLSPSNTRLWSWLAFIGTIVLPSQKHSTVTSRPTMHSSISTRAPLLPNLPPCIISITACFASSIVAATTTPLPSARPSAFRTMG